MIAALAAKLASFRVVMALITSTAVTASVTGPLAIQAVNARNLEVSAPTTTITPIDGSISAGGPRRTSTPPTTTSTPPTTTSTTLRPTTVRPPVIPPRSTIPPATTTIAPTTTVVAALTPFVSVSVSPDHSTATLLDSRRVTGDVYVFFTRDASTVTWYLDGTGAENLVGTAATAPFDLWVDANQKPRPLKTRALTNGTHTITAKVAAANSPTDEIFVATFDVINTS